LRISWLIVGMKPFTLLYAGKPGGYFAQQKKRGAEAAVVAALATRMLSNVQLLPGASESRDARTGGHIAAAR
jgi:hypothetical protein